MNEFYPLDLFLYFKKSNLYSSIFLKNEKFKKSPFCKLQKSGSEAFRVYRSTNDFTFSNPQVIQEQNEKVYDDDVLNDGNNYAYRIYKNVPTEGLFFYHTDHLMTPLQMTDQNQNIVWQAEYYPFGRIYSFSAEIENNLRFPGQYSDYYISNSNLYYNGFRWYIHKLGRYIKVDPLEELKELSESTYLYQNPITDIDYFGLYNVAWNSCKCWPTDPPTRAMDYVCNRIIPKLKEIMPHRAECMERACKEVILRCEERCSDLSKKAYITFEDFAALTKSFTCPIHGCQIHLCPVFGFYAPKYQACMLLHEVSHFCGATDHTWKGKYTGGAYKIQQLFCKEIPPIFFAEPISVRP